MLIISFDGPLVGQTVEDCGELRCMGFLPEGHPDCNIPHTCKYLKFDDFYKASCKKTNQTITNYVPDRDCPFITEGPFSDLELEVANLGT